MMQNKQQAINLCDEAIVLAEKDQELQLVPLTTKALAHFQHGEKEASVQLMNKVIGISNAINDDKLLSSAYRNL